MRDKNPPSDPQPGKNVRIQLLCEGNAETPYAFSGIGRSLVGALRANGADVTTSDVDLYGASRLVTGGLAWSPRRARWVTRYRLGERAFRQRSRNATRLSRDVSPPDAQLQFGATFEIQGEGGPPLFLYCDSNIEMAQEAPHSPRSTLRPRELRSIIDRERRIYHSAAGIFTLSERARRSFIDHFDVPPERVMTVHAGPNLELSRIPPRRQPVDGPPTILFVGREFERKGGDLLLSVFADIRRIIPAARLVIVGPRALELQAEGVEVLGFLRKDVPAEWTRLVHAYATADVFCFPTRYEPFGIVLLEAMLFGLPVVSSCAWAIPEIVIDGETGFTVTLDDREALRASLIALLGDPALARRMGDAGRARALEHFTWDVVARRMLASMAEQSGVRAPAGERSVAALR